MNYAEIVNLIRDTAIATEPNGTFQNGFMPDGSFDSIVNYPIIHLRGIRTTTDRINGIRTHNLTVFFWLESDLSLTPEQEEDIVNEAEDVKEAFMDLLNQNVKVRIDSEISTPEPRQYKGKLSGYGVNFNLITMQQC
jgi:hypothetical protein